MNKEANVAGETELPRRATRSRKLPCWLRSPSPTPLSAHKPAEKLERSSTRVAEGAITQTTDANATGVRDSAIVTPAASTSMLDTAGNPSSKETGPGKRQRRPSSMYKPPEALTADLNRTSPLTTASPSLSKPSKSSRSRAKASTKTEDDSSRVSTRITLRVPSRSGQPRTQSSSASTSTSPSSLALASKLDVPERMAGEVAPSSKPTTPPSSEASSMPVTFTRRGECFSEPHRPRHESCTNDMAGIMSPKPVRTAAGVCRMGMAPVSDDEEDDEEEDHVVDELARDALHVDFAERAWAISIDDAKYRGGHAEFFCAAAEQGSYGRSEALDIGNLGDGSRTDVGTFRDACGGDSVDYEDDDDDDNDFHQTMLQDAELDMLTRVDSPKGSEDDDALTDGHATTPASCGLKDSPDEIRSCTPPMSEETKDTVFAHALPVPHPRTSDSGTHAGSLTLSLPYEFTACTTNTPLPDANGETPLTPVHTMTAAELAEMSSCQDEEKNKGLPALAAPSLPSDLSRDSPNSVPGSPASPTVYRVSNSGWEDSSAACRTPNQSGDTHFTDVQYQEHNFDAGDSGRLDSLPEPPLLDDVFESSETSPAPHEQDIIPKNEGWLCIDTSSNVKLPSPLHDDAELDPFFSPPEKMMALTDLDRAWDWLGDLSETSAASHHSADRKRKRSTHALVKRPRAAIAGKAATTVSPTSGGDGSTSTASSCTLNQPRTRLSRLRSRAL